MDSEANARCLIQTFALSLPLMVWRGPRSQLSAQPAPSLFFGNTT